MSLLKEVRLDNTEKVLELLQSVQDLNQVDTKTGNSLLHLAIKNLNPEILKELLLSRNYIAPIDCNIINSKDGIPPLIAALNMNFTEGATLLLQHKADPKFRLPDGRSVMHLAVTLSTKQTLQQLIKYGVPVNAMAPCGTPLHDAIALGQTENALFLLELDDICLDGQDEDGDSVFHLCASEGAGDILNSIINKIKNDKMKHQQSLKLINSLNKEGNSPLHIASINERSLILQLLKDSAEILEVNLDLKNRAGLTYSQIQKDIQQKLDIEKDQIIQRKKEAQEDKNKRSQQRRQDIIETNERDEVQKKYAKQHQVRAQEVSKTMDSKSRIIFTIIIILVFLGFYVSFALSTKDKKHRNIIE